MPLLEEIGAGERSTARVVVPPVLKIRASTGSPP